MILLYLETCKLAEKRRKENERYQELKREIERVWNIRSIKVIPVAVGEFDSTSKKLKNCTKELAAVISTSLRQKTALLGTARILRKVLDCRYGLRIWEWWEGKK